MGGEKCHNSRKPFTAFQVIFGYFSFAKINMKRVKEFTEPCTGAYSFKKVSFYVTSDVPNALALYFNTDI